MLLMVLVSVMMVILEHIVIVSVISYYVIRKYLLCHSGQNNWSTHTHTASDLKDERGMSTRIQLSTPISILGFQIGRMDSNAKIPQFSLH